MRHEKKNTAGDTGYWSGESKAFLAWCHALYSASVLLGIAQLALKGWERCKILLETHEMIMTVQFTFHQVQANLISDMMIISICKTQR